MVDRLELAQLWQSILRTDPNRLFGQDTEMLMNRPNTGDDLPQPGFVGPSYRPGGVLFLGNNPGNGPSDPNDLDNLDIRHIRALRGLKTADADSLLGSFEALMGALVQIMSEWGVVRNYVRPILSGANMDLDSIAYLNLFKWRSSEEPPARMYQDSWWEHTGEQYRLLRPKFVIALGSSTTFNRFKRVSSARDTADVKVFRLKRARNDQQPPPPETLRAMPIIAEEIREHSSN
jgi:hypothetical protein